MAGHDANTLVQLPDEPNVLADRHRIEPGLVVSGQNYRGSLAHDRGASLRLFSRFLPVGFYYKTFHRPEGRVEALGADHPQLRRPRQSEPERAASLLRQGLRLLRRASWSAAGRPA